MEKAQQLLKNEPVKPIKKNDTFESRDVSGNRLENIFIRGVNSKEKNNPSKTAILSNFPEKKGWDVVYKPYGEKGRGYYYTRKIQK
jgi:hypothetical protein